MFLPSVALLARLPALVPTISIRASTRTASLTMLAPPPKRVAVVGAGIGGHALARGTSGQSIEWVFLDTPADQAAAKVELSIACSSARSRMPPPTMCEAEGDQEETARELELVSESAINCVTATGFFAVSSLKLVPGVDTSASRDVLVPFRAGDRVRVVEAVTVGQQGRLFNARGLLGTVKDFDDEDDETPVIVRLEVPVELLLEKLEWNQASGFECTGLPELLDELGVANALPNALAYCEAQGADSVELLREAGLGDELVECIRAELPRAKSLVLAKRLR